MDDALCCHQQCNPINGMTLSTPRQGRIQAFKANAILKLPELALPQSGQRARQISAWRAL